MSQDEDETHRGSASHEEGETQKAAASQIIFETHGGDANPVGAAETTPGLSGHLELRRLVDVLYDVQDVRTRTANRLRQMPKATREVYVQPLLKVEDGLTKRVGQLLEEYPIYTGFLKDVKGVGPRISGSIIAQTMVKFDKVDKDGLDGFTEEQRALAQKTEKGEYLVPVLRGIGAFDTVSKLWAWFGLHTVDGKAARRRKGGTVTWNPKMRTLAFKIGRQFVLQGDFYRQIYDQYKARLHRDRPTPQDCPRYAECKASLKNRTVPACKGHIDAMSRRYAVKMFLSHLWEAWRRLEGLPIRPPYSHEYLGHSHRVEPPSQTPRETHEGPASHDRREAQPSDASHQEVETHRRHASQEAGETQGGQASQNANDTHGALASHLRCDTQGLNARMEKAAEDRGVQGIRPG